MEPLTYTIEEAASAARISRRSLYNRINSGELSARKNGARTIILATDLKAWLDSLPAYKVEKA